MGDDPFDGLTSAERRFLRVRMRRLRSLGAMVLGAFAEAMVADALNGAEETAVGTDLYDLDWRGCKIEVKSTRSTTWQVPQSNALVEGVKVTGLWADTYVLAHHEGDDHRSGWSFFVVPRWRLDEHGRKSVSTKRLAEWDIGPVDLDGLSEAVEAAAPTARR